MLGRILILASVLTYSSSANAQWSPDFNVSSHPAASVADIDGGRNVAVYRDSVAVVWADTRDGNHEIYFRERAGGIWSSPLRLTTNVFPSFHPAIGRFAGEIRVVWEDWRTGGHAEIWTKRRTSAGWSADSCLTCDGFESARPSLDHTGTHLVWEDTKDGNREIYYLRRDTDGSFDAEFRVSNDDSASSHPTVASGHSIEFPGVDPQMTLVAWQDRRDGNLEIYSRFADFDGWDPETRVSMNGAASRHPSVAVELGVCGDLGFVSNFVAWEDDRHGNDEIYFSEGTFGFWGGEGRLTTTALPSQHPSVTLSHLVILGPFGLSFCPQAAVVWQERTSAVAGSVEFFDLASGNAVPISDAGADPRHPSVASRFVVSSPGILEQTFEVVWTDRRDSNEEIYHTDGLIVLDATDAPVSTSPDPEEFEVSEAWPNPFRRVTELSVRLDRQTELDVRVVDAAGRIVTRLPGGHGEPGSHPFSWDGRDARGRPVASGVYFVRITTSQVSLTRRVVLVR